MRKPNLRFAGFENEWKQFQIKNVLRKVSRPVEVVSTGEYRQIGIRSHGKGIFHKAPVTGASLGDKRVFWVEPNALVVNIVFAWEQAVAVTTDHEEGMVASHRFPMYVAKDFLAEPQFILRLFLTRKGKKLLELASPGGAGRNKTLGQKEFESLKIALPSPPEQRKVAAFISALDDRIAQLRARYEWLTKYKKGVVRKLFAQDVRFKDAAGCEFPDWKESSFGEVAELRNWKYDPDTSAEALRCVELEHVSQETGRLLGYVDSKLQRSVKNRFTAGDVLFGKLRPYLRKYLKAPFDGACSTEIWVLNGKKVTNDFLFYLVQSESFMTTAQVSSGSKMPRADWGVVSSGEVAYPCPEEQAKIAGFLFALDAQIACAESQLESAKRYKQGILRNMFIQ